MFFQGCLQEGIASAVNEAKAVICFVRDDSQESDKWEKEYFADDEFARLLEAKSVLMRLAAGSQEAGFLTSFCPIFKFPAVVVIKNGQLREYFVPEITKEDFRNRLGAVLEDRQLPGQASSSAPPQNAPQNEIPVASSSAAPEPVTPAPPAPSQHKPESSTANIQEEKPKENKRDPSIRPGKQRVESTEASTHGDTQVKTTKPLPHKPQQKEKPSQSTNQTINITKTPSQKKETATAVSKPDSAKSTSNSSEVPRTAPKRPTEYRLQVRLFDGSSVRSSFTPSQTISGNVRPWLDEKMTETQPYNLKHILTPMPNHTLTIAEEERTLEDLGLGPSANLVMVPIRTYTEAYSASGSSLPVRAASATYDLVSSAVGTATGLVGSFLGYGQTAPTPSPEAAAPAASSPSGGGQRLRASASRGPNIRTLRDQREGRDNNEFYNGNQLNFEPRDRGD